MTTSSSGLENSRSEVAVKSAAFALAALVAASAGAGAAAAQTQVSDQQFLQASRCKGLAVALGADSKAVRRFVNVQSESRAEMILHRGQAAAGQAQREAADPARRAALSAELSGACAPYVGAAALAAVAPAGEAKVSTAR
jgi:hypothetical protein